MKASAEHQRMSFASRSDEKIINMFLQKTCLKNKTLRFIFACFFIKVAQSLLDY